MEPPLPVTFNLFSVKRFPECPSNPGQVVFQSGDSELKGSPAQTLVTFQERRTNINVEMYSSKHETLKKVVGRLYDGREFEEFFKKNEIGVILRRDKKHLICRASASVSKDLVDGINESYPVSFRAEYLTVDFDRVRAKTNELQGIWISQLNQPNIETLAMFGSGVDKSDLYASLKSLGHASALLVRHQIGSSVVSVIISSRASITFPQPAAADEQLEKAMFIIDNLLRDGLVEHESKTTRRERKEREAKDRKAARR